MPFGFLLDLWECHKQFMGISKSKREADIDEVAIWNKTNAELRMFCNINIEILAKNTRIPSVDL